MCLTINTLTHVRRISTENTYTISYSEEARINLETSSFLPPGFSLHRNKIFLALAQISLQQPRIQATAAARLVKRWEVYLVQLRPGKIEFIWRSSVAWVDQWRAATSQQPISRCHGSLIWQRRYLYLDADLVNCTIKDMQRRATSWAAHCKMDLIICGNRVVVNITPGDCLKLWILDVLSTEFEG